MVLKAPKKEKKVAATESSLTATVAPEPVPVHVVGQGPQGAVGGTGPVLLLHHLTGLQPGSPLAHGYGMWPAEFTSCFHEDGFHFGGYPILDSCGWLKTTRFSSREVRTSWYHIFFLFCLFW